jgi:hypothetical protein
MKYFAQTCDAGSSRLRRLMCGKALPFRNTLRFRFEAMPQQSRARQSLAGSKYQLTERRSLSAHRAAEPRSLFSLIVLLLEATEGV